MVSSVYSKRMLELITAGSDSDWVSEKIILKVISMTSFLCAFIFIYVV